MKVVYLQAVVGEEFSPQVEESFKSLLAVQLFARQQ
jgi:hypothetical protein